LCDFVSYLFCFVSHFLSRCSSLFPYTTLFRSFFIARVRVKRRDDDDIGFDPNRWKKKRRRPSALRKNIFWIILIVLVVFGLIGKYFLSVLIDTVLLK